MSGNSLFSQEDARVIAGLVCIATLLFFFFLELTTDVEMSETMLWILVGLIMTLMGLDDLFYYLTRGFGPPIGVEADRPSRDQDRDRDHGPDAGPPAVDRPYDYERRHDYERERAPDDEA